MPNSLVLDAQQLHTYMRESYMQEHMCSEPPFAHESFLAIGAWSNNGWTGCSLVTAYTTWLQKASDTHSICQCRAAKQSTLHQPKEQTSTDQSANEKE
jgi:hypothetical protein